MDDNTARAMAALTTGIYVLTVAEDGRAHGMSSSWVAQVSGEPPLVMAAIDRGHLSNAMVARAGGFALNVVGSRAKHLEDYFYSERARRPHNLDTIEYDLSPGLGMPWLRDAMVSMEVRVRDSREAGDHTLFIGEPTAVRLAHQDRPLTSLELDYVYVGGRQVIPRDRTGW
jgi:flavin reductase (DIM6/NTAB) family NADH-FMN oxidoreductase RutF